MIREIKFRAWGNNIKEYMSQSFDGEVEIANVTRILGDLIDQGNWVVEQYTGLKDKDGKEIYEGDIVNIQGIKYYVDFAYGGFWFNNDNRGWKGNRPFTHFQEINDTEVIGNIHENPELLELK